MKRDNYFYKFQKQSEYIHADFYLDEKEYLLDKKYRLLEKKRFFINKRDGDDFDDLTWIALQK